MSIRVTSWSAWFSVDTVHGDRLEFVLGFNEERLHHDQDHYSDVLWDMLRDALKSEANLRVGEKQMYGDVSFQLVSDYKEYLSRGLAICDKTVKAWINKYRVNNMKERT